MKILVCLMVVLAIACGGNSGVTTDGNGGGDGPGGGGVPPGCNGPDLTKPQCSNCIDDDGDGFIDSFDIQCTGPLDRDEATFATGIPGDNMDAVNQDCFFDGDSGAGNDGCNRHVCCILNLTAEECDAGGYDNNYDPVADCPPLDPECLDVCSPLTPPGCDCFGCCTICDDQGCVDVYTNPLIAPDCDETLIHDPTACPACVKVADCGVPCTDDPTDCILCPGQDPADLPDTCNMQECPGGATACTDNTDCAATEFCSTGCCVAVVD
jgi:hypothetical protein